MQLLVATPIKHIKGLYEKLSDHFDITYLPDPTLDDLRNLLPTVDVVYVNPNKTRFRIDREFMDLATRLKWIVTASTGTVHIDLVTAAEKKIPVISLTKELATIEKISSTAELALTLTLAAVRNLPRAIDDVLNGHWDYEKFIGRQINMLKVGVVGYGRLGRKYARYMEALGAEIYVVDPYKSKDECPFPLATLDWVLGSCDIVALHVHVTEETRSFINATTLSNANPSILLVNTSRGEIIDEAALVAFLKANPGARLATDVLANEVDRKWESPLLELARAKDQVLISPHIGGMTQDAQAIAYHRVADLLIEGFNGASKNSKA